MEITIREIHTYTDYIANMKDMVEMFSEYQRWLLNYLFDWKPESFKKMIPKDEWISYYDKAEKEGTFPEMMH